MAVSVLVGVKGEAQANPDGTSRQDIIRGLRAGAEVRLEADPTNPFDRWAVKVLTVEGQQIGWLPSDARDASAVLKGEPIRATVHDLTGGTNLFKRMLGKSMVGVVLHLDKPDPDWSRTERLQARARPFDDMVQRALALEKGGRSDDAITAMRGCIAAIHAFTAEDAHASAHRAVPAPVDRLSLLLERGKSFDRALAVLNEWQSVFDPVQPTGTVAATLRKRASRLAARVAANRPGR